MVDVEERKFLEHGAIVTKCTMTIEQGVQKYYSLTYNCQLKYAYLLAFLKCIGVIPHKV